MAILVRYRPVDEQNYNVVKYKLYCIGFACLTLLMSSGFMVLCVKRRYGEYHGQFFPGVCETWWDADSIPPIPASLPTNSADCGPKKMVYTYVNSTKVFSGYIQYCSFEEKPNSFPTPLPTFVYNPTPFPTLKYNPTPLPTITYKPTLLPTFTI